MISCPAWYKVDIDKFLIFLVFSKALFSLHSVGFFTGLDPSPGDPTRVFLRGRRSTSSQSALFHLMLLMLVFSNTLVPNVHFRDFILKTKVCLGSDSLCFAIQNQLFHFSSKFSTFVFFRPLSLETPILGPSYWNRNFHFFQHYGAKRIFLFTLITFLCFFYHSRTKRLLLRLRFLVNFHFVSHYGTIRTLFFGVSS